MLVIVMTAFNTLEALLSKVSLCVGHLTPDCCNTKMRLVASMISKRVDVLH